MSRLNEIKERRNRVKFTPDDKFAIEGEMLRNCYGSTMYRKSYWEGHTDPSSTFIANAPADIDYLVELLEEYKMENADLSERLNDINDTAWE